MKIVKPLTLGVLHKPFRHQGRNQFGIAALGFFRLGEENERFLPESLQWPLVVPELPPGQPLDEAMPKAHGEALLLGSAHAPDGEPVRCVGVRMCVGAVDKRLRVSGDRFWGEDGKPQPFVSMPLTYARAYGGPGHGANPTGCGYAGRLRRNAGAMPNVEPGDGPHASRATRWRTLPAAGFGPLDISWLPRKRKLGTYGRKWLKHDAPGYPSDLDWSVFNLAPPDQWIAGAFAGGECYRLEGMHPEQAVLTGHLPRLRARAFILPKGQSADAAIEVPLALDTVWFLPGHRLGIAVYHGRTDIADSDGLDVGALLVGYEHALEQRPAAHYRDVLALRLDPATAALHAFDESQLAASRSVASMAARRAAQDELEAAELARQQGVLDALDAEFWAKSGATPPPGHTPARAALPPLGVVSPQAVLDGDFDLAATVAHARALAEDVATQGAAKIAALGAAPAAALDARAALAAALAAALERAALPAYDLLPPGETGRDPALGAQLSALERAHAAGRFRDVEAYAQARAAVLGVPALRRQARRAAPVAALPHLPLPPVAAVALGRHALAWLRAGVCLAGRDLAGADLRGADLTGADLRETMLEGADLRNCVLAGADLRGAVLTGCLLAGADFGGARLGGANLSHSRGPARFAGADLAKAHALSAQWGGADLDGAVLDDLLAVAIELQGATLRGVRAHRAVLLEARAADSNWQRADLERTVALRADLVRADFSHARVVKAVVIEADLRASVWRGAHCHGLQGTGKTDWRGAVLEGMRAEMCGLHGGNFAGANLSGARLLRCDFGGCDLRGAVLTGAVLSGSLFLQADLRDADAAGAEFFTAMCRKADFRGARLTGTNFRQCELTGARFGDELGRAA